MSLIERHRQRMNEYDEEALSRLETAEQLRQDRISELSGLSAEELHHLAIEKLVSSENTAGGHFIQQTLDGTHAATLASLAVYAVLTRQESLETQ
jgi:hypothetical protein